MNKRILAVIIVVALISIVGYLFADWYQAKPIDAVSSYVGRQSCIECHEKQFELFTGSDHDLAMDLATEETVLANFDDQQIEHNGLTSRMFRDGDKFMVHTDGPDGVMSNFEVKYVFGVRPLQQYMVELERPADSKPNEVGRVQVLRISWDTEAKRWFYLMPPDVTGRLEPSDPLHWTGITQNWNASCAVCHSTDLKKNFSPHTREYHTTFSEIDVSCEACHGPGSLHVELAKERTVFWDRNHHYGLAKLKTESNLPQIESCAPCHSRRTTIAGDFRPGCNFDDFFAIQLLENRLYHADGQIRDEDYVYGSFIQSKMFHNGIRCTDCHDPHSTKVKYDGNLLCTSCHQHTAGQYDTPAHHHHQVGSAGASCVECHMPETTYMMVDPRRDHSLRVPRPDLSVELGTPNACTGCHLEGEKLPPNFDRRPLTQYLDWVIAAEEGDTEVADELDRVNRLMADATEKWYPKSSGNDPKLSRYFEQLARGLGGKDDPVLTLAELAVDQKAPGIFRASALSSLVDDTGAESLEAALAGLEDPDPKVVAAALGRVDMELSRVVQRQQYAQHAGGLSSEDLDQLKTLTTSVGDLLSHESRRVRLEAARVFAMMPPEAQQRFVQPEMRRAFELAIDEYKKSLSLENDRAMFHMMLGGLNEVMGDSQRAKDDYQTAIEVEPNLPGPRANLAALLDAEARQLANDLRQSQGAGGGMTAGNLRAMMERMQRTAERAARLRAEEHGLLAIDIARSEGLAGTHGLHYRFAMSSYVQQDLAATEKHLLEAYRQQSENPMYLMGLATYYIYVEQPETALRYIQALLKQDPQHDGYQALADQAQQMLEGDQ
jgi:predicted CXXCH cytochrome family protein